MAPHEGGVQPADRHQPDGVHGEHQAVLRRGQPVDVLEHERRARDVEEERTRREGRRDAYPMRGRCRTTRFVTASVWLIPPEWRSSGARVSGRMTVTASKPAAPSSDNTTKMPRQDVTLIKRPPKRGAAMCAMPLTNMRSENTRAAAAPSSRSRTTARAMTTATPPSRALREAEHDERRRAGLATITPAAAMSRRSRR